MNVSNFQQLDQNILMMLNGSESVLLEHLVLILTSAYTWIPLYLSLLYLVIKNNENWKKILLVVCTIAMCLIISNIFNGLFIKPTIGRLRPINEPALKGIIFAVKGYKASGYSFFSSHTMNAFIVSVFFSLLIREKIFSCCMILWSIIVALTRPFLGVHYPSDIFVGMMFGSLSAAIFYYLYRLMYVRFSDKLHYISTRYTSTGYSLNDIDVVLTILIVTFVYAVFRAVLNI